MARALCDAGCDRDVQDELGRGSLSLAVHRNDLVQLLLERSVEKAGLRSALFEGSELYLKGNALWDSFFTLFLVAGTRGAAFLCVFLVAQTQRLWHLEPRAHRIGQIQFICYIYFLFSIIQNMCCRAV